MSLGSRGDAPGAGEQALKLAVGAILGGDKAYRAVGQPAQDPHVSDRVAERRLGDSGSSCCWFQAERIMV